LEPVSLPGSVTGEIRKAWKLTGCLAVANPQVLNPDGSVKPKQDIRGITHLHHALDACVLGLAAFYFERRGNLWVAMVKRRPSGEEAALLRQTGFYQTDSEGRFRLIDFPEVLAQQIRQRLAEKRVVQHVPADMGGVRVEENTRGIQPSIKAGRVALQQKSPRDPRTGVRPEPKKTEEAPSKLLGLEPLQGTGKLKRQNGVRVITDNFGVAILDHAPEGEEQFVVIPWHRVWHRLEELKEKNGGKRPRVLRNGMLIEISGLVGKMATKAGRWRVFSVKQTKTLDLGAPDRVVMESKGIGVWREVSLESLGPGRIRIISTGLALSPET
jgi:CRISPR-associated endonuclease Csn1